MRHSNVKKRPGGCKKNARLKKILKERVFQTTFLGFGLQKGSILAPRTNQLNN